MDAALLQAEIDRLYLVWGLQAISGLELDGTEATPERLGGLRSRGTLSRSSDGGASGKQD